MQGAAALLLDHGADVNIVAGNGMTPLDVADANGVVGAVRGAAGGSADGLAHRRSPTGTSPTAHARSIRAARERRPRGLPVGRAVRARSACSDFFKRTFSWSEMRAAAARTPGQGRRAPRCRSTTLRGLVAHQRGFASWVEFARSVTRRRRSRQELESAALPHRREAPHAARASLAREDRDWDEILVRDGRPEDHESRRRRPVDRRRARAARPACITSRRSTSAERSRSPMTASLHLARLSRTSGARSRATIRVAGSPTAGSTVLRHLPELRRFQMCWQSGDHRRWRCQPEVLRAAGERGSPWHAHRRWRHRRSSSGKRQPPPSQDRTRRDRCGAAAAASAPDLQNLARRHRQVLADERRTPSRTTCCSTVRSRTLASPALAGLDGLFGLTFFWHISALTGLPVSRDSSDLPNLGFPRVSGPAVRRRGDASHRCNPSPCAC